MTQVNATELAKVLGLTKGRISQYVSSGQLDGCFTGTGRARRFDLAASARALNRRLDKGQLMGNGATTRKRLRDIEDSDQGQALPQARPASPPQESGQLGGEDPDRYELARTLKAEEEARRLRRQNAEAEGHFVLASEVQAQVARQIGQEIAEVETMLRDAARRVADDFGVDYREVRQLLVQTWRAHRGQRATTGAAQADAAALSDAEQAEDF
jgi:transcriptional regulator with XRE-family HTH domain